MADTKSKKKWIVVVVVVVAAAFGAWLFLKSDVAEKAGIKVDQPQPTEIVVPDVAE